MRNSKRVISLLLCAIMVMTSFVIAVPMLGINASAATIDGVTQERIVTDYESTYDNYAASYLNGAGEATDIVIPGLNPSHDYVVQGMTYYAKRDWMLVTAYHNAADGETVQSSKVFALDAASGEFVAMFSFLNPDGTPNTEHGGGIAVSENNIYYACGDDDRQIAYAPVSAFENAPLNQHTTVQLVDMVEFNEIGSIADGSKTAYTAYVCYDEGILWTGNFYDMGVKILGISVAATDYSVPANNDYNSMVFGYELVENVGSTPAERSANEWNYLMGNVVDKDCRGNPSHVIGLNNSIKDVQYATVDNGKLYLSCSFGTGEGTASVSLGGMDPTSHLIVADIDLSQPGTRDTTITTHKGNRTVKAHDIQSYKDFPMMPMSEGLCVINDKIYITFESASNKYLNEAGALTGNCNHPIDVIWELDPYELMEVEVAEPEKSIYYEKLHSLADIKDGDEYIIVHESDQKDPVSQKNYLYALNADGNFHNYKLSKSSTDVVKGYDGMIGHPITYYSFEKGVYDEDILYLEHPEDDDIESIRWTITKIPGLTNKYNIKTTESYFANCNNFYFDGSNITMAPSNATYLSNINIGQLEDSSGYFYLSNSSDPTGYYLWCNDGINEDYNNKANQYYLNNSSLPALNGTTEVPGTFHCDALNVTGKNILGGQIDTSDDDVLYEDGAFQIYRRVVDETSSTYESRVYTDLDAELQEDGTYTVTLETYAISPNHYQYVGGRPTDYIIVADTSSSMATSGSTGVIEYGETNTLGVSSLSIEANTSDDNDTGVSGYAFTNPEEEIYIRHTDGKLYQVYMAVNTTELKKFVGVITSMRQKYYAYYIADDGLYYCIEDHKVNPVGRTQSEWKAWVDSGENESDYSTKTSNTNRRKEDVYVGTHYRFATNAGEFTRLQTMQNATNKLVDAIAAQNSANRIALVQYGADASTGFWTKAGVLSTSDYSNAFWATGTVDQLKTQIINNLTTSAQTNNNGIEFEYVNNIIANSGQSYKADGTRNVAVVFLTDGIPGADNSTSSVGTAANNVIAKALTAKNNGAFVYTVLLGNASVSGFDKKTYMDAVSTKYAAAVNMNDLGGQSVDGARYAMNLSSCTFSYFDTFGEQAQDQIAKNVAVGLDKLSSSAILQEKLSEAFLFPAEFNESEDLDVDLVPGVYDKIGRFSFDESAKIKQVNGATNNVHWDLDTANRTIQVRNYDYAAQYINRYNDGKKLRITIRGLEANPEKKIQNTSINDVSATGIFKTKADMNANNAFKYLPTEYFNIPEYTYVLDYGLQMYDADVNGTLKSVSSDLSAQRDANGNLAYKSVSENGLVEIANNNLDLIYRSTPTNFADSGYCLIQRDDGTYDWFEIKVVPASNVLFEEDYVVDKEGSAGAAWENLGTPKENYQTLTNNQEDVYGYDSVYATTDNSYSNGTASKVAVSSTAKRSVAKTFDFIGEGFDLISACGANTGMLAVTVKDSDGNLVKGYLVDTYYNGEFKNGDGLACQVPVVKFNGAHGTYTVEVNALYLSTASALSKKVTGTKLANGKLSATTGVPVNEADAAELLASVGLEELAGADLELVWFDDNSVLNGGTGAKGNVKTNRAGETSESLDCYVDGFRIYHPIASGASEDYIASEQHAQYVNVIECLKNNQIGTDTTAVDGIAYVVGALQPDEETGETPTLSFANYQSVGPQNELYLKGNSSNALVLKVQLPAPTSRVQLGLRAVTGTADVTIGTAEKTRVFEVKGATEMYYDITDCLNIEGTIATITIQNTGAGVLAVNNIKLTGDATMGLVTEEDMQDAKSYMMADPVRANVVNGVVTPVEDDDADVDNNTSIPGGDVIGNAPSFVQELLAKLFDILSQIFTFLPVGEVL